MTACGACGRRVRRPQRRATDDPRGARLGHGDRRRPQGVRSLTGRCARWAVASIGPDGVDGVRLGKPRETARAEPMIPMSEIEDALTAGAALTVICSLGWLRLEPHMSSPTRWAKAAWGLRDGLHVAVGRSEHRNIAEGDSPRFPVSGSLTRCPDLLNSKIASAKASACSATFLVLGKVQRTTAGESCVSGRSGDRSTDVRSMPSRSKASPNTAFR